MKIPIIAGILVGVLSIIAFTNYADAAVDMFLKIDSIPGEATSPGHEDWINLLSVSQSVDRSSQTGTSGTARQRASAIFSDIVAAKDVDKSSPKLFLAVANGEAFPEVLIDVTTDIFEKRVPYLQWELKNARITSYSISGSAGDGGVPTDTIALNYEEVKYSYTELDSKTGKSSGKVEATWKIEEGES